MRKWIAGAGLVYVLYGLFIYWYLFMTGDAAVPEAVRGTEADPASVYEAVSTGGRGTIFKHKELFIFYRHSA
ncbi:hypothetical protein QFZ25_000946 [Bacillus atrophaeus]|nr:hypothetical protein [Bacillus atrophaeus]